MNDEIANWLRYYRDLGFTDLYRRDTLLETSRSAGDSATLRPSRDCEAAVPGKPDAPVSLETMSMPPHLLASAPTTRETLDEIFADLGHDCRRCKLWKGRKSIVFGSGNPKAQLVFVGEGPGADEDEQGLPFVGRAGQLLTEMIEKGMKIPRPDVYICNIVKCRPPDNRKPEKDEVAACRQFVERQIDAIRPRVICALGATAAETLLGVKQSMGSLRGRAYEFRGFPLIVTYHLTYHPAFLLRDPTRKRDTWEDLKLVMTYLKAQ
jgi:uracil-DNA glycosylase